MKQLHAKWTTGMYDDVTSVAGDAACFKDQEVPGISGAVQKGLKKLPHINPFNDIDPLASEFFENEDCLESPLERGMCIHENNLLDN